MTLHVPEALKKLSCMKRMSSAKHYAKKKSRKWFKKISKRITPDHSRMADHSTEGDEFVDPEEKPVFMKTVCAPVSGVVRPVVEKVSGVVHKLKRSVSAPPGFNWRNLKPDKGWIDEKQKKMDALIKGLDLSILPKLRRKRKKRVEKAPGESDLFGTDNEVTDSQTSEDRPKPVKTLRGPVREALSDAVRPVVEKVSGVVGKLKRSVSAPLRITWVICKPDKGWIDEKQKKMDALIKGLDLSILPKLRRKKKKRVKKASGERGLSGTDSEVTNSQTSDDRPRTLKTVCAPVSGVVRPVMEKVSGVVGKLKRSFSAPMSFSWKKRKPDKGWIGEKQKQIDALIKDLDLSILPKIRRKKKKRENMAPGETALFSIDSEVTDSKSSVDLPDAVDTEIVEQRVHPKTLEEIDETVESRQIVALFVEGEEDTPVSDLLVIDEYQQETELVNEYVPAEEVKTMSQKSDSSETASTSKQTSENELMDLEPTVEITPTKDSVEVEEVVIDAAEQSSESQTSLSTETTLTTESEVIEATSEIPIVEEAELQESKLLSVVQSPPLGSAVEPAIFKSLAEIELTKPGKPPIVEMEQRAAKNLQVEQDKEAVKVRQEERKEVTTEFVKSGAVSGDEKSLCASWAANELALINKLVSSQGAVMANVYRKDEEKPNPQETGVLKSPITCHHLTSPKAKGSIEIRIYQQTNIKHSPTRRPKTEAEKPRSSKPVNKGETKKRSAIPFLRFLKDGEKVKGDKVSTKKQPRSFTAKPVSRHHKGSTSLDSVSDSQLANRSTRYEHTVSRPHCCQCPNTRYDIRHCQNPKRTGYGFPGPSIVNRWSRERHQLCCYQQRLFPQRSGANFSRNPSDSTTAVDTITDLVAWDLANALVRQKHRQPGPLKWLSSGESTDLPSRSASIMRALMSHLTPRGY